MWWRKFRSSHVSDPQTIQHCLIGECARNERQRSAAFFARGEMWRSPMNVERTKSLWLTLLHVGATHHSMRRASFQPPHHRCHLGRGTLNPAANRSRRLVAHPPDNTELPRGRRGSPPKPDSLDHPVYPHIAGDSGGVLRRHCVSPHYCFSPQIFVRRRRCPTVHRMRTA